MLTTILVILLVLWLLGYVGYGGRTSSSYYHPIGLLGVIVLVLLIVFLASGAYAQTVVEPSIPNSDALSTKELWAAAVGLFLPMLIAVPIQPDWPTWARPAFAFGLCIIAATVTAWLDGALQFAGAPGLLRSCLLVLMAAWSSYHGFWKATGLAPRLEAATTVNKQARHIAHRRLRGQEGQAA